MKLISDYHCIHRKGECILCRERDNCERLSKEEHPPFLAVAITLTVICLIIVGVVVAVNR